MTSGMVEPVEKDDRTFAKDQEDSVHQLKHLGENENHDVAEDVLDAPRREAAEVPSHTVEPCEPSSRSPVLEEPPEET